MFDTNFFSALTPNLSAKFYVALTGTSSLISGIIMIFEWWYFKKYGVSFIEQVSVLHISPWVGNNQHYHMLPSSSTPPVEDQSDPNDDLSDQIHQSQTVDVKVWRNPLNLFRGAEYQRYYWATNKEPLTYYDMNLSAQDHQTFFTCEADNGKQEFEIMQTAWRERNPLIRIKAAREALKVNENCAPAYILLAEEEATVILDAENILKTGLQVADSNYRKSQKTQHLGPVAEMLHKRDVNVLIYIKRRLAMCYRKLGKLKEAAKLFRDLTKEIPPIVTILHIHENLIEVLLEMQAYTDCQLIVSKYEDMDIPKSATLYYTMALLKARLAHVEKFSSDVAVRRGLSQAELSAIEAIHKAVEFNPHVPKYLLEMKSIIFPPEHILKRGDSEAVAYAFFHLRHWKNIDGALNLLSCTWEGAFRLLPCPTLKGHFYKPYSACTECGDRELLPDFHKVSVYPEKTLPFFITFTALLCSCTTILALLTHQYPDVMSDFFQGILDLVWAPINFIRQYLNINLPQNIPYTILQTLTRI